MTDVSIEVVQETVNFDLVGPGGEIALAAAARAEAAEAAAEGFKDDAETAQAASETASVLAEATARVAHDQPNLVTKLQLSFDTLPTLVAGTRVKATVNGLPCVVLTVNASTGAGRVYWRVPASAFPSGKISAQLTIETCGAGNAGTINVIQRNAGLGFLEQTTLPSAGSLTAAITTPTSYRTSAGITLNPSAAWVDLNAEFPDTSAKTRTTSLRNPMLADGNVAGYRRPRFIQDNTIAEAAVAAAAVNTLNIESLVQALYNGVKLPPSAFGWTPLYPFVAFKNNGVWKVTLDPKSLFSEGLWTAPAYYVSTTGSDAADGLTDLTPLASISAAIAKGRAGGVPFRILIAAGTYDRNVSAVALGGTACPEFAMIATGGRVVLGAHQGLTWADDGSGTNTYTAARTSVGFVVDRAVLDAEGNYTDIVRRADGDVAGVRANAGTWCQNGANVVVHRADGAAVTDANTRVYLTQGGADFSTISTSVYCENIDWEGGAGVRARGGVRNTAYVNCTSKYMGWASAQYDAFLFSNIDGVSVCVDCYGDSVAKDAFNSNHVSTSVNGYVLLVRCRGRNNGRFGMTSCNGVTAHNATDFVIDVGGEYSSNDGANIAFVGGSKGWMLGTSSEDGNTRGFWADGSGTALYIEDTTSDDTDSVFASNSAAIYKRNHTSLGVETATGSGTISTF